MFWLILGLIFFRWPLFKRFFGVKGMFLFDALLFTVISAVNFANPGPGAGSRALLGYTVGGLCAYFGFKSARQYLQYDELLKKAQDEQEGKSDDGTASGS